MSLKTILFLLCAAVWAQSPDKAVLEKQADELRALVVRTPNLPLEESESKIQPGIRIDPADCRRGQFQGLQIHA